jgi:hypothetical protein
MKIKTDSLVKVNSKIYCVTKVYETSFDCVDIFSNYHTFLKKDIEKIFNTTLDDYFESIHKESYEQIKLFQGE